MVLTAVSAAGPGKPPTQSNGVAILPPADAETGGERDLTQPELALKAYIVPPH